MHQYSDQKMIIKTTGGSQKVATRKNTGEAGASGTTVLTRQAAALQQRVEKIQEAFESGSGVRWELGAASCRIHLLGVPTGHGASQIAGWFTMDGYPKMDGFFPYMENPNRKYGWMRNID